MRNIPFTKMHGAGNDYIYVNCFSVKIENPNELAKEISQRHYSIGSDGLVLICPSTVADAKMRMFNADGSEGEMCGNAIRCVGKYLYDYGIVKKESLSIETLGGIKYLKLSLNDEGFVETVTVDMGYAELNAKMVPVDVCDADKVIDREVMIGGKNYNITCMAFGCPHCVTFTDSYENFDIEKVGPLFENSAIFPNRVNAEFIIPIDRKTLEMRVWERGSGETFACGTGACAAVTAACIKGLCDFNTEVTVKLKGGDLYIICKDNFNVFMRGNAIKVYDGILY